MKETTFKLKDLQSDIFEVNVSYNDIVKDCTEVEREIKELNDKDLERIFNVCHISRKYRTTT